MLCEGLSKRVIVFDLLFVSFFDGFVIAKDGLISFISSLSCIEWFLFKPPTLIVSKRSIFVLLWLNELGNTNDE